MASLLALVRPFDPIIAMYEYEMGRMAAEPYGAAATEPKELCLIAWASHFDLYDREPCVAAAAAKLQAFFDLSLA